MLGDWFGALMGADSGDLFGCRKLKIREFRITKKNAFLKEVQNKSPVAGARQRIAWTGPVTSFCKLPGLAGSGQLEVTR
jgi:hypothetical protein